jgi:hypothetical protein
VTDQKRELKKLTKEHSTSRIRIVESPIVCTPVRTQCGNFIVWDRLDEADLIRKERSKDER